ncbi:MULTISPECIES: anaerobic sulfatase maturase [Providencia]|uniref:anaerobic sulfatase maturase n=1 Tax=Providencia TaxID=586 RepID=UPI0023496F48|nr:MULTISPECIES: anaerobic sulfatase maturase [Providencia]EMB5785853.1 anaerobic sulfatase maturase [Providencia rettgeri]MDK7744264.1 anaerobic sulfatase maturase [Providencia rettgeri]MDK7756987.1 anaerobic sulfatase maturase [Providencia rettgeri]
MSNTNPNFQLMAKPSGSVCNIDCTYCFYLEKSKLYPNRKNQWRMSDEVLEQYIHTNIEQQPADVVEFVWQGGEPTLLGLGFYKNAVALQQKYAGKKKITNSFQTNALNLDDDWCQFFKRHHFLLGVSIDGDRSFNDEYRLTRSGKSTFDRLLASIELLKKYQVDFNTLTVVNNFNVDKPIEIYEFLKSIGSYYMQFIPVVERQVQQATTEGLSLISPEFNGTAKVTDWSVDAIKYGQFLNDIFDHWQENDIGKVFVMNFEQTMSQSLGLPSSCVTSESCGANLVLEANGDLYSCDHFVYPENKIGNLMVDAVSNMLKSDNHQRFSSLKKEKISADCLPCEFKPLCHGGCPKHRFLLDSKRLPKKNYFCDSYKIHLSHSLGKMKAILEGLQKN